MPRLSLVMVVCHHPAGRSMWAIEVSKRHLRGRNKAIAAPKPCDRAKSATMIGGISISRSNAVIFRESFESTADQLFCRYQHHYELNYNTVS